MSAPDASLERQEAIDEPVLLGLRGVADFGGLMLLSALIYTVSHSNRPSSESMVGTELERERSQLVILAAPAALAASAQTETD